MIDRRDLEKFEALAGVQIKYPCVDAALADRCKYNVVRSHVHRYVMCSTEKAFVRCSAKLIRELEARGYGQRKLLHVLRQTLGCVLPIYPGSAHDENVGYYVNMIYRRKERGGFDNNLLRRV